MSRDCDWKSIDSSDDLIALGRFFDPEDARVVEVYASPFNELFFPTDVCRDGHQHLNWRLALEGLTRQAALVEVVFIACELLDWHWLRTPYFDGKVDSLRRVELFRSSNPNRVRCARLIYRTHPAENHPHLGVIFDTLTISDRSHK